MTRLLYRDKRSSRVDQFLLSQADVDAGELEALRSHGTIKEVIEFYFGEWYIIKVEDLDDKDLRYLRLQINTSKKNTRVKDLIEQVTYLKKLIGMS